MHDPVAWNGKRGWDVIHFPIRYRTHRRPQQSIRENGVDTIRDQDGETTSTTAVDAERQARWEEQERAAASASRDIV